MTKLPGPFPITGRKINETNEILLDRNVVNETQKHLVSIFTIHYINIRNRRKKNMLLVMDHFVHRK